MDPLKFFGPPLDHHKNFGPPTHKQTAPQYNMISPLVSIEPGPPTVGRRGLVVKASDFHARGHGFDFHSGQATQ